MESKNHEKVGILLDFENLARAAMNDVSIASDKESMRVFFLAIGKKLLDIAKEYGDVKRAYLAFSRPKEKDGENQRHIHLTHEMIAEINSLYANGPYTIISTVSSNNAVDEELVRMGMLLIADQDIKTIIVGSGDGREPFAKLFNECVINKKLLHVVFYEKKPHIFHGDAIPHAETFLAADIRFAVEAGKMPILPSPAGNEELSPAKIYKKILRAIMHPTENEKCDRTNERYKHVVNGLMVLKSTAQSQNRHRVKRTSERTIAELLVQELDKLGMRIEMHTALDLTRAFVFMNVFSFESSYSLNESSDVFTAAEWDQYHYAMTGTK